MTTMPFVISAPFAGALALLMLWLAIDVTRNRARTRASLDEAADGRLHAAVRRFGNAAEYVPIGVVLMALAEANGAPATILYAIGGLLVTGRVIHPFGIDAERARTAGRVVGMVLTWAAIGLAAVVTLGQGLGAL